jgi:hypothetical protein
MSESEQEALDRAEHDAWFEEYLTFLSDEQPTELPNKIPFHYERNNTTN